MRSLNILKLIRKMREKAINSQFVRIAGIFFEDFCKNSTLHGVRYFTVRVRHWSERLWWVIAVGLVLWLSTSMIHPFWLEWQKYPMTMITTNEKNAVSKIPFPTVVICPETKIIRNKFDLSSKFDSKNQLLPNVSHTDKMRLSKLANLCPRLPSLKPYRNDFADEDIFNVIEDVAPNIEHITLSCAWKGAIINCSEYLEPILTHQGVCITFNGLNSRDIFTAEMAPGAMISKSNPNVSHWSMENGYEHEFGKKGYPIRVTGLDQIPTLEINLVIDKRNEHSLCPVVSPGFLVYLTTPHEPNLLLIDDEFEATLSRDTSILLPKLITTSNGLRKYSPKRRQCFFQSERKLRFYKTYSKFNCLMECWANLTKKNCGCVDFSMPRDRNTKICGATKINCFLQAQAKFDVSVVLECNCWPACTSTEYPYEIEQFPLNVKGGKQLNQSQHQARLRVSLQNSKVKTLQRIETVTVADFLAMCGGVLGLFMGFSAMTVIELIYYPFLRLFWMVRRLKTEEEESNERAKKADETSKDNEKRAHSKKWTIRLQNFLIEYCDNSNIHGMRYFSEPNLHWIERCYWAIFCVASLLLCGWMTYNVLFQWQSNPVLMKPTKGTASRLMTPLPTITICSEVKTTKRKLNLTSALNNLSNLSRTENQRLNALANVCPLLPNLVSFEDKFANLSIYDTIQDIAPQFNDTLIGCIFSGNALRPCSPIMQSLFTDEGFCFAFNALNSHEMYTNEMAPEMMIVTGNPNVSHWSLENGYDYRFYKDEYPTRLLRQSIIVLSIDKRNLDHQCNHFDGEFKVILTPPGEVLKMSRNYFRIDLKKQNTIFYEIKMMKTSDGLRNYTPNQRHCFYQFERRLRFFRMYTQANCEEECLASFTSIECGCVHFSMPRDNKTRVCGGASVLCPKAAKKKLLTDNSGSAFHSKCNCLPACVSIEYKGDIQRISVRFNREESATVNLQFKSMEVFERVERFTVIDFLAYCGGLLGSCLGISVLSLIEIIFFITLRLFWTIRRWKFENTAVHPMNQESFEMVTIGDHR